MRQITIGLLFLFLYPALALSNNPKDITIKYFSKYSFKEEQQAILHQIEVSQKEIPYLKSFWRVYYDSKGQVFGEEYFKNWRLHYYHLYRYTKTHTHKQGFYWHGITQKAFFHIKKQYIWQGYYFKRTPNVWWVYDLKGRLKSKTYYSLYEKVKIDYSDLYFYKKGELNQIDRYRNGIVTKVYHKSKL